MLEISLFTTALAVSPIFCYVVFLFFEVCFVKFPLKTSFCSMNYLVVCSLIYICSEIFLLPFFIEF